MATKTVKDEKTADVPAEKNSARVKTSSVQHFQCQIKICLRWKKLKRLYQNLKIRR